MHRAYRLADKQDANLANETLEEPNAKKSRLDNRIVTMDNGTMVDVFKFLNYCQLAKKSLVSKRFRDLIQTHRHTLALLYVDAISVISIYMGGRNRIWSRYSERAVIKIFDNVVTPEAYNESVVRNNYSNPRVGKRFPGFAGSLDREYELSAYGNYTDPNQERASVLFARVKELNHETWPLFEHFIRLLTDPFIYIRFLGLIPQQEFFNLFAATIDRSNRGRLQCDELMFYFEGNSLESLNWIKDHVRCVKFAIEFSSSANRDKQVVDFIATGSQCMSEIFVMKSHFSKAAIIDLVQRFTDLKKCDESQIVHSIRALITKPTREVLNKNYGKFFVKEGKDELGENTERVFEFVNVDIGKKFQLTVIDDTPIEVLLKIINLTQCCASVHSIAIAPAELPSLHCLSESKSGLDFKRNEIEPCKSRRYSILTDNSINCMEISEFQFDYSASEMESSEGRQLILDEIEELERNIEEMPHLMMSTHSRIAHIRMRLGFELKPPGSPPPLFTNSARPKPKPLSRPFKAANAEIPWTRIAQASMGALSGTVPSTSLSYFPNDAGSNSILPEIKPPKRARNMMNRPYTEPTRYPAEMLAGIKNKAERERIKDKYEKMNPHLFPRMSLLKRIVTVKRLVDQGTFDLGIESFEKIRFDRFRSLDPDGNPVKPGERTMLDWVVETVEKMEREKNGQPSSEVEENVLMQKEPFGVQPTSEAENTDK
ncbi:hypothetical protein Ddc_12594 [Ditylenchus destructor]|nr:hypothetical protein Ddc_12594 [Ditylenchus destructor]